MFSGVLRTKEKGGRKWCVFLLLLILTSSISSAAEISIKDIIQNIQTNQAKIKDMSADTITTITSSMKGMKKMVQKGKILTKAPDKSRIEITSPMRQITITNGDKVKIINPDTGQSFIQDLKKLREKSGGLSTSNTQQVSLEKVLEYFNLSVSQSDSGEYIITGVPKKKNMFLGKMEFYIDKERWVPTKIVMYNSSGKTFSSSTLEYEKFSGVWVPIKNMSTVVLPNGRMKTEMVFENVKVNQGVKNDNFKV